jgi:hypothetical protein
VEADVVVALDGSFGGCGDCEAAARKLRERAYSQKKAVRGKKAR